MATGLLVSQLRLPKLDRHEVGSSLFWHKLPTAGGVSRIPKAMCCLSGSQT